MFEIKSTASKHLALSPESIPQLKRKLLPPATSKMTTPPNDPPSNNPPPDDPPSDDSPSDDPPFKGLPSPPPGWSLVGAIQQSIEADKLRRRFLDTNSTNGASGKARWEAVAPEFEKGGLFSKEELEKKRGELEEEWETIERDRLAKIHTRFLDLRLPVDRKRWEERWGVVAREFEKGGVVARDEVDGKREELEKGWGSDRARWVEEVKGMVGEREKRREREERKNGEEERERERKRAREGEGRTRLTPEWVAR